MQSIEDEQFRLLVRKMDPRSKLLRAWPLTGGVSAQITAMEILRFDGRTDKMIVRRHGERDLRRNPDVAADEFRLLHLLQTAEVAAPRPCYLDHPASVFAAPCIVVEFVEGNVEFDPLDLPNFVVQLAAHLARIHRVDGTKLDLSFLPSQAKRLAEWFAAPPTAFDPSFEEERIRESLKPVWPLSSPAKAVLLHGDFWPGNVLWKNGRLAAVIDWEDAEVGDPLADLANCRLELMWAFGTEAMNRFTQHYCSLTATDPANLPYWDLCSALQSAPKIPKWGLDERGERKAWEGLSMFADRALEAIEPGRGFEEG